MNDKQRLQMLLVEVGPLLDNAAIVELDDLNNWLILLDDQLQLFAEYIPDQRRLYLSADVGDPPEEKRLEIYSMLLQFNLQWQESSGLRFAIDSPGGTVVQVFDVALDSLDATQLQSAIAGFLEMLIAWRKVVTTLEAEPSPETPDEHVPAQPPDAMLWA